MTSKFVLTIGLDDFFGGNDSRVVIVSTVPPVPVHVIGLVLVLVLVLV